MKKLLLSIFIITMLFFSSNAFAGKSIRWQLLNDSAGTVLNNYALTSTTAVYTETLNISKCAGYISILVVEDKSGGAGDVDISAQYSIDGTNWYTAYTTNMAGVLSAEGLISEALGNSSRWIVHTVRASKYMRYKLDPDANSEITMYVIIQEEN